MARKTHPIVDDDNTTANQTQDKISSTAKSKQPGSDIPPALPESKRQISDEPEKSRESVEVSDSTAAPYFMGPTNTEEGPIATSLQRHFSVDDELDHFKRLMQRRQTEESDSQPGAHHVEGPHLHVVVEDGDEDSSSSPAADEVGLHFNQRNDAHQSDDPEGDDPFAEPFHVPSAYLVADEELGQITPPAPPVIDPFCPSPSDLVPTIPTVSMVTNLSSGGAEDDVGGGDSSKKKDEKNKSGCAMKVPCCELRLSTPFLVVIAVFGIIAAIIVIVLGAKYANGGGENKDVASLPGDGADGNVDIPIIPDPPIVDPAPDDTHNDKLIIDIGDIDFSKDGGDEEDDVVEDDTADPDQPPTDADPPIDHEVLCRAGNNGGCDPLTTCAAGKDGHIVCGPCPDGYGRNGLVGCKALDTAGPPDDIPEVLTDCNWQKLLAVDGEPDKRFGQHVAISGDLLAVGAAKDNEERGAVYVYERSDVSQCCWSIWYNPPQDFKWKFTTKLTAPDGEPGDTLTFVDISKHTIAVGAKRADVDGKEDSGAAYIWRNTNDGGWSFEQKLAPDDLAPGDLFSNNLTLDGETLIATARLHDAHQTNGGAAYIFRRNNGKWKQEQKLMPDDLQPNDEFGSRAVLQGDRAVVSAYKANDMGADSGADYVFKYDKDEKEWRQEAKLTPNDGVPYALFGINLAIDHETIMVGAYNDTEKGTTEDGEGAGAAYVFSLTPSGEWVQTAKILAADGEPGHKFGRQVGLNGNVMVVSSLASYLLPNSGALYIFRRTSENTWEQQSKLMTKHVVEASFGSDISLDGLTILAGARYDTDNGYRSGSAYIIDLC